MAHTSNDNKLNAVMEMLIEVHSIFRKFCNILSGQNSRFIMLRQSDADQNKKAQPYNRPRLYLDSHCKNKLNLKHRNKAIEPQCQIKPYCKYAHHRLSR